MRKRLEQYFEFASLGATWRTEILAGATTFVTMAYILFVNPSILSAAGMPAEGVMAATAVAAALGSVLMGVYARYPIALAPGMGLNAYFAFSVVKGMGVPWQTALGAVFISGVLFLLLTAAGIRQLIVSAIPRELFASVAAGVGLFIALIGLRSAGIVVPDAATTVALGNLRDPNTALALFGLLVTAALIQWRVRAAILIGVLATTAAGAAFGLVQWTPGTLDPAALTATAFRLDIAGAARLAVLDVIFVFLFVDLFDNLGTLVAVGKKAGLFDAGNRIPRLNRILFADSIATIGGALAGTSTVVSYIESSAGVAAGGRTGVTAIVTGLLFLASLVVAPVIGVIPAAATAPALILVGAMMMTVVAEINWEKPSVAIPAFLTMLAIPLTFSIANGLAFGFTAFTLLAIARGEWRKIHPVVYALTALFLLRFAYLGKA